jgi:hypothetical protein
MNGKHREERALLGSAQVSALAADYDFEGTKQPELHVHLLMRPEPDSS